MPDLDENQQSSVLPLRQVYPAVEDVAQDDAKTTEDAGKAIQSVGRGFRLSFRDLGHQRKLHDSHTNTLLDGVDVSKNQVKFARVLYDSSHPAIKEKNRARAAVEQLFRAETLPYTEKGVRLFPVRSESAEEQAAEVEQFIQRIRGCIADFDAAVGRLQIAWDGVMQRSREKLGDLFVAGDYPLAEELPNILKINLEPCNVELPNYYKHVSPEEYNKAVEVLEKKFEESARMQEDFIVQAFQTSLNQMLSSVSGYNDGKQKRFANSVVVNVFDAIEEFRSNVTRFGILKGTALEAQFNNLHQIMTEGSMTQDNLPNLLRTSEEKRGDFLTKVADISTTITQLANDRPRRSIVRD